MTPAEAAKLLAKAAAFDQRTIGRADALAWAEVLADISFDDALDAVTTHYAESTERLMPAHVRRIAVSRRNARHPSTAIEGPPPVPLAQRSANGEIEQLRAILPAIPGILRRREWYEHDLARERHLRAVPNPDYDPTALARLAGEEAS